MHCQHYFLKEKKTNKKTPILPVKLPPQLTENFLPTKTVVRKWDPPKADCPSLTTWARHWSGVTLKYRGETRLSESRLARSSRIMASDNTCGWFSQVGYFSLSTHLSLSTHTVMKQHEFKCLKVVLNFFSASHMQQKKNGLEKEIWANCTLIAFHC